MARKKLKMTKKCIAARRRYRARKRGGSLARTKKRAPASFRTALRKPPRNPFERILGGLHK